MELLEQIAFNTSPGPYYESDDSDILLPAQLPVRVIAYYLPQFHAIRENDAWWGKGFTEWTNVTKALPRYVGHYQPRLPGALGFYDLRLVDNLRQQAALARRHGVEGFCFHYYWFGGRRLLDAPLMALVSNPDIDLPFCINWANENWTRRWDGQESKVLIQQTFSPEDDVAFARDVEPLLRDPRYIRINGRPLIMLYRPGALPKAQATLARWREYFVSQGVGDPYLVMPQAFGEADPRTFGFDAAAGFPPHHVGWDLPSLTVPQLLDKGFGGRVRSYDAMARRAMALDPTEYKMFHGVCPDWDNEARRPGRGRSFLGSTPQKYGQWLASACRKALREPDPDERIVFVNAWNEWGEGAYLEPDRHYGHAFLRETARTVSRADLAPGPNCPSAPESHDTIGNGLRAYEGGAPQMLRKARLKTAAVVGRLADLIRPDM